MPLLSTYASATGRSYGARLVYPFAVFTAAAGTTSVNEGSSLTLNVVGPADGNYYWTINHITTVDADFDAVSGSFTIADGRGTFSVPASDDRTTEGSQTFSVSVRAGSITGPVLSITRTFTINDTSLTPAASISPAADGYSTISLVDPAPGTKVNFGGTSCGTWTITPNQDFTCTIKVWGAGGGAAFGSAAGGGGGYTEVYMTLLKNTSYQFTVGCGGAGGSGVGNGYGSGGGAGSSVRISGGPYIAVAGGGGGGGFSSTGGAQGGAGGGYLAQEGGLGSGVGPAPTQAGPYYGAGGGETLYDGTPGPVGIGGRGPNGSGSPGSGNNGGPGGGPAGGGAGGTGFGTGGSGGRNGAGIPSGGGGGGAGWVAGGGGGYGSDGHGGGGGSGYWDGFRTIAGSSETGSNRNPGNSGDADRGSAGTGAVGPPASTGNPGKIVWVLA